jgi:Fe-Mn family superoxide dismutase
MVQNPMVPAGQHVLPPLPYPYNALVPVIGALTLQVHHDVLHKKYVDNLNKTELALAEAREKNDYANIQQLERELAYNGSGDILHSIYWTIMAPQNTGGQPGPATMKYITEYFGNFKAFTEQFTQAAINVMSNGWALLVWQPMWYRLEILTAERHQDLTQWGVIPILVVDVWEHAYYLDYLYKRKNYVDAWWNIINWYEVERRLIFAINGRLPLFMDMMPLQRR